MAIFKFLRVSLLVLVALVMVGFSSPARAGDTATFSTILGMGVGSIIGNQYGHGSGRAVYTGLGAVTGGFVGHAFGSSLENSRHRASRQTYYYRPQRRYYSQSYQVVMPYTPNYVAPPAPVFVSQSYCREYVQPVMIGGYVQQSYGTACLQPDGSWQIQR